MNNDMLHRELPDSFNDRVPAPPDPQKPASKFAYGVAIESFLYLLATAACLYYIGPKFAEVYRQVHVDLPLSIVIVLTLSRLVRAHYCITLLLLIFVPWGLGRLCSRRASVGQVIITVIGIGILLSIVVTLFLPLIDGLEGIGPRKY